MKFILMSIGRIRQAGYAIVTDVDENYTLQGVARILHKKSDKTILIIEDSPKHLDIAILAVVKASTARKSDLELSHRQLCHLSKPVVAKSSDAAHGLSNTPGNEAIGFSECEKLSKSTRKTRHALEHQSAKRPLDRVYSDIFGLIQTESVRSSKVFATLLDKYRKTVDSPLV